MDRAETLSLLKQHKPVLAERFGVTALALFGSVARGTAHAGSDADVLVAFDGPATSERYFGVLFYLEDRLHRAVDLVTVKALRERLRPYVERDAIHVRARHRPLCRGHARVLRQGAHLFSIWAYRQKRCGAFWLTTCRRCRQPFRLS